MQIADTEYDEYMRIFQLCQSDADLIDSADVVTIDATIDTTIDASTCEHTQTFEDHGLIICRCGEILSKQISHDKEWYSFGLLQGSNKQRCTQRKDHFKGIYQDIEQYGFSPRVADEANHIYSLVSDGKILRGDSRKSIIFASIYYALRKLPDEPRYTPEDLIEMMQITKRVALRGFKRVKFNMASDYRHMFRHHSNDYIIDTILHKYIKNPEHLKRLWDMYEYLKTNTDICSKSRPQSIIGSILSYFIKESPIDSGTLINEFQGVVNKTTKEIHDALAKGWHPRDPRDSSEN